MTTTTGFDEDFQRHFGDDEPPPDDPYAEASENPTQKRLAELRSALVDSDGLDTLPDPLPVVDSILFRDSLAWLYGKPGSCKSFVGIDWAGCVGGGLPWNGREVTKGRVLYLVAEGTAGIRQRVRAWEKAFNTRMENVVFLPIAVQLLHGTDHGALKMLVAEIQPTLIIIDTQARCTIGANENDNGEMSTVVAAADELREATGACVLMIHHSGRSGENMRGASALDGAATSVMKVTKDEEYIELHCEKQKDIEPFDTIFMRLKPVLESCVLESRSPARDEDEGKVTKNQLAILASLRASFEDTGASPSQLMEDSGVPKASIYRSLAALVRRARIKKEGTDARPRYLITESGRSVLDDHSP